MPVVRNHCGSQAAQNDVAVFCPAVVQKDHAGVSDLFEVLFVQHPFMVAQGQESRSNGGAMLQEGQDIRLGNQRGDIVLRLMPVDDISRDGDDLRFVFLKAGNCLLVWPAVQVPQQGQDSRDLDGIGRFLHGLRFFLLFFISKIICLWKIV